MENPLAGATPARSARAVCHELVSSVRGLASVLSLRYILPEAGFLQSKNNSGVRHETPQCSAPATSCRPTNHKTCSTREKIMMDPLFIGWAARQQSQASRAEMVAENASATAGKARSQVDLMQLDVERLLLITEALWTLMKEKHGYSDEQLIQTVQEIDMRDGRLDGKVAKQPPLKCANCGRTIPTKRTICMYCGAATAEDPFKR